MMHRALLLLASAAAGVNDHFVEQTALSDWCAWVPPMALQYVSECNASTAAAQSNGVGCLEWCPWVPAPAWQNISDCQRCVAAQNRSEADDDAESPRAGLKVARNGTASPGWCKYVPWGCRPEVPKCVGYEHGYGAPIDADRPECRSWCQWVPGPSWSFAPGCQSCIAGGAYYAPGGLGCESWCTWVPRGKWWHTAGCLGCIDPAESLPIAR
ncbi:GIP [Symbiodinium sp. KB8]|nr:GIP [Symbiodinium sp. KB8]